MTSSPLSLPFLCLISLVSVTLMEVVGRLLKANLGAVCNDVVKDLKFKDKDLRLKNKDKYKYLWSKDKDLFEVRGQDKDL